MLWSLFPSDNDSVLPACLQFIGDSFLSLMGVSTFFIQLAHFLILRANKLYCNQPWVPSEKMNSRWRWRGSSYEVPGGGSKDFVSNFGFCFCKDEPNWWSIFPGGEEKNSHHLEDHFFFVVWATDDANCTHFINISGWCSNYFDIRFNFVSFSSIWWHPRCWEMTPRSHCFSILKLKPLGLS